MASATGFGSSGRDPPSAHSKDERKQVVKAGSFKRKTRRNVVTIPANGLLQEDYQIRLTQLQSEVEGSGANTAKNHVIQPQLEHEAWMETTKRVNKKGRTLRARNLTPLYRDRTCSSSSQSSTARSYMQDQSILSGIQRELQRLLEVMAKEREEVAKEREKERKEAAKEREEMAKRQADLLQRFSQIERNHHLIMKMLWDRVTLTNLTYRPLPHLTYCTPPLTHRSTARPGYMPDIPEGHLSYHVYPIVTNISESQRYPPLGDTWQHSQHVSPQREYHYYRPFEATLVPQMPDSKVKPQQEAYYPRLPVQSLQPTSHVSIS